MMVVSVYVKNYCTFATQLTVRRIRCLYYRPIIVITKKIVIKSYDTKVFRKI